MFGYWGLVRVDLEELALGITSKVEHVVKGSCRCADPPVYLVM
jgi:hypothetical protein